MYSGTFQRPDGIWVTNWHEYNSPDDIDWDEVKEFCLQQGLIAYGYQHGKSFHSRNLTSAKTRTVLWQANNLAIQSLSPNSCNCNQTIPDFMQSAFLI